jgi:hypothetical protein
LLCLSLQVVVSVLWCSVLWCWLSCRFGLVLSPPTDTSIKDGVPRKKGMSSGAHKMSKDTKSYKEYGKTAAAWMQSADWTSLLTRAMQKFVPGLDMGTGTLPDFAAMEDDDESEEAIDAWGWQPETSIVNNATV